MIARVSQRVGITFALIAQGRGTRIAFTLARRFLAEEPPPSQARMAPDAKACLFVLEA
jgi:hypothetical protein